AEVVADAVVVDDVVAVLAALRRLQDRRAVQVADPEPARRGTMAAASSKVQPRCSWTRYVQRGGGPCVAAAVTGGALPPRRVGEPCRAPRRPRRSDPRHGRARNWGPALVAQSDRATAS